MKRRLLEKLVACRADKQAVALVTDLASGRQCLMLSDDTLYTGDQQRFELPADVMEQVRRCRNEQRSTTVETEDARYLIRAYAPPLRLLVVGAVHIAQCLLPMARLAGFEVHLIDPRDAFAAEHRFPGIEVIRQWPDEAFAALSPDASTAVATLSHDPKIDDPALQVALASDAFYVGALGSRKTHAGRLQRLSAAGMNDDTLKRIHAPIGLPLGGRAPAEIAVSILAEIIQTRY
jgi:xanthine dehydrogenase accessory factor